MKAVIKKTDLIVFSHERWNSSFSRTSQIMSHFSKYRRVYFFEEPILGVSQNPIYLLRETRDDVVVVEPYLSSDMSIFEQKNALLEVIKKFINDETITEFSVWSDTPKAMPLIRSMRPKVVIYDCIADYSQTLNELETEMFNAADVVLTSSQTLYAAKRSMHSNIHNNPDSLDYRHFYQTRSVEEESDDISSIPHPRIGFSGDIDNRIDFNLVKNLAELKPEWHFIFAGEIKDIDPETLPKNSNIHYISHKSYSKIPMYLAAWDCTFLPYKVNESTKFLNPILISESLVGGKPVVASPLDDVRATYGDQNLIYLAEFPHDYVNRIEYALSSQGHSTEWLENVDKNFRGMSWDKNCRRIAELEMDIYAIKNKIEIQKILKDLFNKPFQSKETADKYQVNGINLRKIHSTSVTSKV